MQRGIVVLNKKTGLKWEDWVLVFGLILTTMTKLRISGLPVGPGEICLLLWMGLKIVFRKKIKSRIRKVEYISKYYWILMLITFFFGTITNVLFWGYNNSIHNIIAYIFCMLLCLSVSFYVDAEELGIIIEKMVLLSTITFFCLYMVVRSKPTLYWFYDYVRYTGGAKNPNQLGFFICTFPFLCLAFGKEAFNHRKIAKAIIWVCCCAMAVFLGMKIQSDAVIVAWLLATTILIFLELINKYSEHSKLILLIGCILIIIVFIIVFMESIIRVGVSKFESLDEDGSRVWLWGQALGTIRKSFLFGFGPGSFLGTLGNAEAHNTFLDFFLQGGVGFAFFFLFLLMWVGINNIHSPGRFSAFVAFSLVLMAHFVGRQPIFYIILIYFISSIRQGNRGVYIIVKHD